MFSAPLVERVLWASLSQLDGVNLFANILAHWNEVPDLTHAQKAELARLVQEFEQLKTVLSDSLSLIEQLQQGLLKQVMTANDLERVRAFLSKGL